LQDIIEGNFPADSRFDRYSGLLLPLGDQLTRLRGYNQRFWDNRVTNEQFAAVDTSSDHTQSVDDLEIFHVEFGSLEETVEMWWKVLVGTQPKNWRWGELKLDPEHLGLGANTKSYEPGIHRVRINLVAHWEPEDGPTIEEVREQAKGTGEILAHSEVLSAYGLHPGLLQEQDGENLPYSDMPGFEVTVPGKGAWRFVLYVGWYPFDRRVALDAPWVVYRDDDWAAPVLRES
jgi:hypothetical protein